MSGGVARAASAADPAALVPLHRQALALSAINAGPQIFWVDEIVGA